MRTGVDKSLLSEFCQKGCGYFESIFLLDFYLCQYFSPGKNQKSGFGNDFFDDV